MQESTGSGETRRSLNSLALFAGIGGIESGLERAGHSTRLFCEIDPGALAVLKGQFPGVERVTDVREIDRIPTGVNLLTAGFPCQDLSQAGGTKGIEGGQSGLVSNVFRLLAGNPVPWVLLENVPFMLQLKRGSAISFIAGELERLGYQWAYRVIDSRAFGLPQRRERVFLLASRVENPAAILFGSNHEQPTEENHCGRACGFYWTEGTRGLGWAINAIPTLKGGSTVGIPSPPAIWMPDGRIVTPDIRDAERLQGFPAGWTVHAESVARPSYRWKLIGNAVTSDVAHWIGDLLAEGRTGQFQGSAPLVAGAPWPKAAFGSSGLRFSVKTSTWPMAKAIPPLEEFLEYPVKPLSEKATRGFIQRLKVSSLRYPADFMVALERHLDSVIRSPRNVGRRAAA
jgi:DNA (cytosine-5)-methyltransferase 1